MNDPQLEQVLEELSPEELEEIAGGLAAKETNGNCHGCG